MKSANQDPAPAHARPERAPGAAPAAHAARAAAAVDLGRAHDDLDECAALKTLTSAVQVLETGPQQPAADRLVQSLQTLAQAFRRRARAVHAQGPSTRAGESAERQRARAELLAQKAEDVAQWARTRALGGDPGLLDQWLATHRSVPQDSGRRPGGATGAARPAG